MSKITAIIPVYNVEKYIHRCVDSVLNQTFDDFELILIDDGSTDKSGTICDNYVDQDERVFVIHKNNGGPACARNTGIEWALKRTGEWITFIDSDDCINNRFFEILYNIATANNVKVSSCGYNDFDQEIIFEKPSISYEIEIASAETLIGRNYDYKQFNMSVIWGRLYHKSLLQNIRFPLNRFAEDEFTVYKLLYGCDQIALINIYLYYYYYHSDSVSHIGLDERKIIHRFDSYVEKIHFFYKRKYRNSFYYTLRNYCLAIENSYKWYWGKDEKIKIIDRNKKKVMQIIKKYRDLCPEELKRKGYSLWLGDNVFDKKEAFKKDYAYIKAHNNFLVCFLWKIKNYHKYKV